MPKHLPTFKHLISSSFTTPKSTEKPEKSVNQLIASSRSSEGRPVRDAPPHPHTPSSAAPVAWVPGAGDVSVLIACGMPGEAPIHPAELLRRSELARRQASRSVAGPVPPPSWRANAVASSSAKAIPSTAVANTPNQKPVTKRDLIQARSLFTRTLLAASGPGAAKLVEYCLSAVLLHLESEEVIYGEEGVEGTIGEAMREQVGYLDPHLKIALFDVAAVRSESTSRLSDQSIRAVLHRPPIFCPHPDDSDPPSPESSDTEWAAAVPPDIHFLPLILHPNPLLLLRELPSFSALSLTSLNLAHSTVKDLERLVTALPGSLRELGLVGIRFARQGRGGDEDAWKKGLALLGKKMIVLKMLDLSYPSVPISATAFTALHIPERTQIPSLTLLGMRGTHLVAPSGLTTPNRRRWIEVIRDDVHA